MKKCLWFELHCLSNLEILTPHLYEYCTFWRHGRYYQIDLGKQSGSQTRRLVVSYKENRASRKDDQQLQAEKAKMKLQAKENHIL